MPEVQATIDEVSGFQVAGVHCGMKKEGQLDFALIVSDYPCVAAGVFTTNHVKAAPVLVDMQQLKANPNQIRVVAVNTRSANACTGQKGIENAYATIHHTAQKLGCDEKAVLVMSTGVIGLQLPMDKILNGVELAAESLGSDWLATANAIMTTDTRPKLASIKVTKANGQQYTIAGISKGAGMIAPNMATMLSVIVTDVEAQQEPLQEMLSQATSKSFNQIVVDGDMSTNDSLLLLANGASGVVLETPLDHIEFQDALQMVCVKLAQDIVRDGEGATKFITLRITGAQSDLEARQLGNAIATSPLVKTAFFGADANWGRMIAAVGRAGVSVQPENLRLWIAAGEIPADDLLIFAEGMPTAYKEAQAIAIFQQPSISVVLDCGVGSGMATIWTCDLSHEYVSINGDYRS